MLIILINLFYEKEWERIMHFIRCLVFEGGLLKNQDT
jgi:hypothetical protein